MCSGNTRHESPPHVLVSKCIDLKRCLVARCPSWRQPCLLLRIWNSVARIRVRQHNLLTSLYVYITKPDSSLHAIIVAKMKRVLNERSVFLTSSSNIQYRYSLYSEADVITVFRSRDTAVSRCIVAAVRDAHEWRHWVGSRCCWRQSTVDRRSGLRHSRSCSASCARRHHRQVLHHYSARAH